ncbi:hypothetical protein ACRAWD_10485 [Caulobacter segnis]
MLDPEEYGLIGPGQFRVGSILEKKKRRAFTGKLEWRPNDKFKVVVDGLTTKLDSRRSASSSRSTHSTRRDAGPTW